MGRFSGLAIRIGLTAIVANFSPTVDGWTGGDHELICYTARLDGAPVTQSLKVAQ